ncbi:MAG: hypothetical protein JXB29_08800 [Sedimentisphaerales bacterium]|nr:hypothetical protein [Sedimentisphaerales bacterium]
MGNKFFDEPVIFLSTKPVHSTGSGQALSVIEGYYSLNTNDYPSPAMLRFIPIAFNNSASADKDTSSLVIASRGQTGCGNVNPSIG